MPGAGLASARQPSGHRWPWCRVKVGTVGLRLPQGSCGRCVASTGWAACVPGSATPLACGSLRVHEDKRCVCVCVNVCAHARELECEAYAKAV